MKRLPALVGLGRLVDVMVRLPDGRRATLRPTSRRFLAWDGRDLVVAAPVKGKRTAVPNVSATAHRRFHGAAPRHALPVNVPELGAGARLVGLAESITYQAQCPSASKGRDFWHHWFGDTGKRGHQTETDPTGPSPYGERHWPEVWTDNAGTLVIRRRAGNRYTVRDWIYG
jgi:hypothetical protein